MIMLLLDYEKCIDVKKRIEFVLQGQLLFFFFGGSIPGQDPPL